MSVSFTADMKLTVVKDVSLNDTLTAFFSSLLVSEVVRKSVLGFPGLIKC